MFGISLARISLLTGTSLGGGVGVSPTLDLNFRGQGYSAAMAGYTFNQLIDFTRTSAATYVDASGRIVPTPASRNLLTFTQEFDNAAWTKSNANAYPLDPAAATLGPELVTNGTFGGDSTTGWVAGFGLVNGTFTASGGVATLTQGSSDTAPRFVTTLSGLVIGASYRLSFTAVSQSGVGDKYIVWTSSSNGTGGSTLNQGAGATWNGESRSFVVTATATTMYVAVGIQSGTTSSSVSIDNISVKELSGGLIAAPDGTLTADTLVENTANTAHLMFGASYATITAGSAITASVYAKAGNRSRIRVDMVDGGINGCQVQVNLSTGVVVSSGALGTGSLAGSSITSVGNGWYRISVTGTAAAASTGVILRVLLLDASGNLTYTGDGTSGIYIWGAQLEANTTATDYTRNNGGVYPPRFDYDPVTLAPKGLLVEEQRTNLLRYSEQIDNAAWAKDGSTVTANATTSPDGTANADLWVPSTTGTIATTRLLCLATVANATAYTVSVYVKASGRRWVLLTGPDATSAAYNCWFDLQNCVVGTKGASVTSASIVAAGGGWYRISATSTSTNTNNYFFFSSTDADNSTTVTASGGTGIFIWGAQLEAGDFATSYIPTVASQVTRTADVPTITGANFSQFYNQSEGTFVAEIALLAGWVNNANNRIVASTAANSTFLTTAGATDFQTWNGTATLNAPAPSPIAGRTSKVAMAYAGTGVANNLAIVSDGGTVYAATVASQFPTVPGVSIGSGAGAAPLNGHIRSIKYFPVRLSNAQLQALTA